MIRTLLIANRGEIVRRIARTARSMGIRTVAVFSEPDASSPHVGSCDLAVALGGVRSDESYLSIDKILAAARSTGADAIHPGYGFLSEDPRFAEACVEAGLVWVGPTPAAMRAMAAKIEAKAQAATLGVPLLPGAEVVGDDPARWRAAAERVGWPLLLKASAGGGGKGMRVVRSTAELDAAVEGGRREALASFGDGTVFLERYLAAPRHIEVQVFGDQHGNVVHLFERECSIQRRHQKVIEEAPSAAVDDDLRTRITDAAVALATGIGYVGAGTVEFLVDGHEFFFLEMNTRLQVEHTVTEEILGIDLVRLQIDVAQGHPLGFTQAEVIPNGHAIEARLYAEDVPAGFLPAPGTVFRYRPARHAGIRFEDCIEDGTVVGPNYDPLVAKVIAHGSTRIEAALRLAAALEQTTVFGLTTNRDLLVATLRHEAFLAADTTTAFFDDHPEVLAAQPASAVRRASAVAAALVAQEIDRPRAGAMAAVPSGWRNVVNQLQQRSLTNATAEITVGYRFQSERDVEVVVDDEPCRVRIHSLDAGHADLEVDGVRRRIVVDVVETVAGRRIGTTGPDGHFDWSEPPRFTVGDGASLGGGPVSPLPGTVVNVAVQPGSVVSLGDVLVVIEAMKMEHTLTAHGDGVVATVLVEVGDSVDAAQLLLTFEE